MTFAFSSISVHLYLETVRNLIVQTGDQNSKLWYWDRQKRHGVHRDPVYNY